MDMDDLFRTLTLSNVSGDMLGTAKDVLGSDWSNSSDWSDSQTNKQEQNNLPLTASQRVQAGRSPSPNLASISEQTNVVMTSSSAVTGTSSSALGLSRPSHESTGCSAVLADLPANEQMPMRAPSPNGAADMPVDDHDDAASEFSRSSSSNWGQHHQTGANTEAPFRLQLSELIGRGAFGSVYKGIWKGRPAAIKVVEHNDGLLGDYDELDMLATDDTGRGQLSTTSSSLNGNSAVVMEAALSSAVMHTNVVQTYDYQSHVSVTSGGQETYVIMEWCDRGSLESAVSDGMFHPHEMEVGQEQPDMSTICATLLDVSAGMAYLHRMHILHCDLKLKNVLLKSTQDNLRGFTAKVSDFGLSKLLPDGQMQRTDNVAVDDVAGTVTHMAPELLSGSKSTMSADVYAFGVLMYELWTGKSAFPGLSKVQIMVGVVSSSLRPAFPTNCPSWYSALAAACWAQAAASRPSFLTIQEMLQKQPIAVQ